MVTGRKQLNKIPLSPIDFVILTALEEEREAILSKLSGFVKLDKESDDTYTYYFATTKSQRNDGSFYQVVVANLLNMGPINATALTVAVIKKWQPKFVILVGIACGIKGEVNYGDVLIATQIADYTLGKQKDGIREVRWDVYPSGATLLDSANNMSAQWMKKISTARPVPGDVNKVKGVIASGGDVISDDDVIATYSKNYPKLVGIEMESGGVAAGVHQAVDRPEFIMIKSVSDFGKDKHDVEVTPWRKYACHTAAAFVLGLIKSGPVKSSLLINENINNKKDQDLRKEEAERRWRYIQNHAIISVEISFYLKSPVGYDWFVNLLNDIDLSFSREKKSIKLSDVLDKSLKPNTTDFEKKSEKPYSSFWEIYEHERNYWCKRIKKTGFDAELVAGFDSTIPWEILNVPEIVNLKDLSVCDLIGISFPPEIFSAGLEEVIFTIKSETYSFSAYISEEKTLEVYHKMASTFFGLDLGKSEPMHFSFGFQGVQLLNMFHNQMMPDYKRPGNNQGIFSGQSGPQGNAIYFYPSIPKRFHNTNESKEYSFTIPGHTNVDYNTIEKELKKEIETNKDSEIYVKLATLYTIQRRFQEVIEFLTNAKKQVSFTADMYGLLGGAYGHLGRLKEALNSFKEAALLDESNPKTQLCLGQCYEQMDDDEMALNHFENAVKLDSTKASHFYNLSLALGRLERLNDAIVQAKIAVSLSPDDPEYLVMLGYLLFLDSQTDESLTVFENAIKIDPNSAKAFRYSALIFVRNGEIDKAMAQFETSISLKKDIDCYADFGRFLCDSQNWKKAEEVIEQGLAIEPNHHGLLIYMGVAKANQGNIVDAVEILETADKINPEDKTAKDLLKQIEDKLTGLELLRKKN